MNNQSNLKSNNIKMRKIVFKIKKTQPNIKMSISNKKTLIKRKRKSIIKKNEPINKGLLQKNKRDILKVLGFKSIAEAYKDFGLKKGDISVNDMYELAIDIYNSDLEYKKEQKLKKQLLRQLPKFIEPLKKTKIKAKKDIVLDEGTALNGYTISKSINNANIFGGISGFNLVYKFIPFLRKSVKELGNIKIKLNYNLLFIKEDEGLLETFTLSRNFNQKGVIIINNINEISKTLENDVYNMINNVIPEFQKKGTGWRFERVSKIYLNVVKYQPIKGGSYIELPTIIKNKKSVINIKNKDNMCFKYCILFGLHQDDIKFKPERVSKYKPYLEELNDSWLSYPVQLKHINKFERLNNISINVYALDDKNKPYVLQISKTKYDKMFNLLLIDDGEKQHYTFIKNFSRFMCNDNDRKNKTYYCLKCLTGYRQQNKLLEHNKIDCGETKTSLPFNKKSKDGNYEKPFMKFKNEKHEIKNPFRIYADFESVIQKYDESETKGLKDRHKVMSYGLNIIGDDDYDFCKYYHFENADENIVIDHFINTLLDIESKILPIVENIKNYKIPVVFHNLKNYDAHLIISNLKNKNFSRLDVIASNFEKFMTFGFSSLKFIDSFSFLSSSLDTLSGNLERTDKKYTLKSLDKYSIEEQDLLLKKGIYPYEYISDFNILYEKELPPIEKFYSKLSETSISKKNYMHGKKVWDTFKCDTIMDYHDLYLQTDVMLLTDVFETFINLCIKDYKLDPSYYISLPSFGWDVMMKMTKIEFEQLTDIDKYIFFEKQKRGGLSMITKKHGQTKILKKSLKQNDKQDDKKELNSVIKYLDANNLYGLAMVQKLPYKDFEWCEFNSDIKTYDFEGDIGYTFEVDLVYPKELHDLHNDFPLTMVKKKIEYEELSDNVKNKYLLSGKKYMSSEKLIPTFLEKDLKKYVIHGRNLQFLLNHGLEIKKIHRVMRYKEKAFLKSYIDFNTMKRTHAKNEFEKDFYKLMNNSVFGKTMENVRGRTDIRAIMDKDELLKLTRQPYYNQNHIISEDLVLVQMKKRECKLDKPIYVGASVLDLSKLHMQYFWYDVLKKGFGEKVSLLFTDTDSLCFELKTKHNWEYHMNYIKDELDLSNLKGKYQDNTNKKVLGKFKCETEGKVIEEFIGLRPKMYSLKLETSEKLTCKGVKKHKIKNELKHQHYKECLFDGVNKNISYHSIQSKNHQLGTYKFNKIALTSADDKRYWIDNINSLTYGHYKISV